MERTRLRNNPIPTGKRSDDKAIIILLGLTGAGKTTTDLVSKSCSATSTIMEYNTTIVCNGDEYELKIFDTPGFGDTRQKLNDARFVARFDDLLRTHNDLRFCYPTTVLLVIKFNDDRIDGETSHFIQMLKAIDAMLANYRLIDKTPENVNLIFVLTHTMSETNGKLRTDPRPKIQLIECLVKTFTKIPTPINVIMAENKPKDYNLPLINHYYKLPNGQLYPSNLFQKIQAIAFKANDVVGETIIREAFKNPAQIKIQLTKEYELLPENNMIVRNMLKTLQSAKFNIENTRISETLRRHWDMIDEDSKKPYFNSLQIAQDTFHRHKIFGEDHLPQSIEGVLKLLRDLPLNPPIVSVLQKLGVEGPEIPRSLPVGYFYNIFTDSAMSNSPFLLDAVDYTNIGFRAADGIKARTICESLILNSFVDSYPKYYQERLVQLSVEENFKIENFNSEPKEGYNIIPLSFNNNVTKLSGIKETRIFHVYLTGPRMNAGFLSAIRNLPESIDTIEDWNAFFRANGTHIVQSLFAGGCISVSATKRGTSTKNTTPQNVLLIIANILKNVGTFCPMDLNALAEDWEFRINFIGGNPTLSQPTLQNIFSPSGVQFYKKWAESLYAYPAMLNSEIGLEPITSYIRKVNPIAAKNIKAAMMHLFCFTTEPTTNNALSPQEKVVEQMEDLTTQYGHSRTHSNDFGKSKSSQFDGTIRSDVPPPQKTVEGVTWGEWFKKKFRIRKN